MKQIFRARFVCSLLVGTIPFGSGSAETPQSKNSKVILSTNMN
jgi:hypothetical protein